MDEKPANPLIALARSRSRYKGSRLGTSSASQRAKEGLTHDQAQKPSRPYTRKIDEKTRDSIAAIAHTASHELSQIASQPSPHQSSAKANGEALASLSHTKGRSGSQKQPAASVKVDSYRDEKASGRLQARSHDKAIAGASNLVSSRSIEKAPAVTPRSSDQAASIPPDQRTRKPKTGQYDEPQALRHEKSPGHSNLPDAVPGIKSADIKQPKTFDAPLSAVNAGERRVSVEYQSYVLPIAVNPLTTPMNVVNDVGTQLKTTLSPEAVVVTERFSQLGLERHLRWYERIRDILNSWDHDSQNHLVIHDDMMTGTRADLNAQGFSDSHARDISVRMYYSQRPRQWDKQRIDLRPDGHVVSHRKGSSSNICHLSDFDIYLPTKTQCSKKIKPPKKVCFAIKSQQKASMFLKTETFVHMFSTSDKEIAAQWYGAVQGWRSWYLINVMGEGSRSNLMQDHTDSTAGLGTQKPKAFLQHNTEPTTEFAKGTIPRTQNMEAEGVTAPPTDRNDSPADPFRSNGLLGRTYTQKKKAQDERNKATASPGRSFSNHEPLGTSRRAFAESQVLGPKPLVDLTPNTHAAPQHRRGKGLNLQYKPEGGLVEVATSPEHAIPGSPTSPLRRSSEPGHSVRRSNTTRTNKRASRSNQPAAARLPTSMEEAPFSKGLLSSNRHGQGELGHGRGVQTGNRNASHPMMDVSEGTRYAPGSLLASVEAYEGDNRKPVIQREALVEIKVPYGESRL